MNKILTRAASGAGLAFTLAVGQWAYSQSDDVTSERDQSIAKGPVLSPHSSIPVQTPIQPQELPQLTLTGVAQAGLEKFALLVVDESGKPPQYYKLTEGEQRDEIEVVAIEVASRIVTVRHRGTEMLLSFAAQKRAQQEAEREQERFNQEHIRTHELHEQLEANAKIGRVRKKWRERRCHNQNPNQTIEPKLMTSSLEADTVAYLVTSPNPAASGTTPWQIGRARGLGRHSP